MLAARPPAAAGREALRVGGSVRHAVFAPCYHTDVTELLSLYLHIPFCTAKCGYCDFNSYAQQEHLVPSYTRSLLSEARLWHKAIRGRPFDTVFFGGGTPSLLPIDELRVLFEGLRDTCDILPGAEVTLEANPGSLDECYLRALRDIGINRLSIGVQSLHDDELRSLDRLHSADDARAAYRAARTAGFDNVNIDLIYGLQNQPLERWKVTLEEAIGMQPQHVSLYALTVEDGTPLARQIAAGRSSAPDPDTQAEHYEWTCERMMRAGCEHYEISNWALPGYRCRHNVTYWECREYLGLGAGAHSFLNGVRFSTAKLPQAYMELVERSARERERGGETPMRQVVSGETMTEELAMSDTLILGLRMTEGVSEQRFRDRFDVAVLDVFGPQLEESIRLGLVERAEGFVRLTERGRFVANEVFVRLLPDG
jgi:oxygen-independent coproporphyrinogen-3 oxidase